MTDAAITPIRRGTSWVPAMGTEKRPHSRAASLPPHGDSDLNPEPTDYEAGDAAELAPVHSIADARAARTADAKVAS